MDGGVEELEERLRALDAQTAEIARERTEILCTYVERVGGVTEAAARLGMDARALSAHVLDGDLAMVVYRGRDAGGVDDLTGREFGETAIGKQRDADRGFWFVTPPRRPQVRLHVVVVDSEIVRVWDVDPDGAWEEDPEGSGKVALPIGKEPLGEDELRRRYRPGFALLPGKLHPARRGVFREYLRISGALRPELRALPDTAPSAERGTP